MVIFYFSGTGNSKYVTELFCGKMGADCHSIEEKVDFTGIIATNDTVGFCYPIYGSRVPLLMREFVMTHIEALKSKKVIIFCTQMIFSGDGVRVLTDLMPQSHVDVVYAEHFLMPNNVCNLFFLPVPGDKTKRRYLSKTHKKMDKVCNNIKSGKVKKRGFNPVSRALGMIQGVFYPGLERRARKKVWISEKCSQCSICVALCPMENFRHEDGTITANNKCIMCYRCINRCPQKAVSVFLRGKVKTQYTGVKAQGTEIA